MQAISWLALFISAIGYHAFRLLTFQHDGRGLPQALRPITALLVVLYVFAGELRLAGAGGVLRAAVGLLIMLAVLAVYASKERKPTYLSGYLILSIALGLLYIVARDVAGCSSSTLSMPFLGWELAASIVLWTRIPPGPPPGSQNTPRLRPRPRQE